MRMNNRYDEIINLPHHVSKTRPQMPMSDRAAQFAPFAALTGYESAIKETGRLTDEKIELDEESLTALDMKYQLLMEALDDAPEVIHDRVPVQKVEPMTDRDYSVRGCTALLDAIGGAIHHIGNIHKYARKEDVPEHTLFVITTDGMENASRRYDSEKVKKMIERQKEKYGWEFLFLGANIDAVETAKHFGIGADRAVNYHSDREGTQLNYEVLSEAVSAVRCSVPLGTNWKKRIDEDFNSRKDGRK